MKINRSLRVSVAWTTLLALGLLTLSCASVPKEPDPPLVPITVAGARWIELSPVVVAAEYFYPQKLTVSPGGVPSITSKAADLATNAETQLLRESVTNNPDLRIIMTVSESFYRLVGRRSSGISKLSDLKGKRVIVPANTLCALLPRGNADQRRTQGRGRHDSQDASAAGGFRPPANSVAQKPWRAAMRMSSPPSSPSLKPRSGCSARTPSCCRTRTCTAKRSTFMPARRIWRIRRSAAPSWLSCALRRRLQRRSGRIQRSTGRISQA